ncbi:hypothetical protein AVEN_270668-1 [Araneus ventricosus]|uniref:Uncharacterized protein n=1 Tax=Araneus ventricosus TaxID=182803 RepID=A0A4Y2P6M6_ARAVE|nr:hypothetical protein AVEN_270668-1 [Araneus ventricosus]
MLSECLLAAAPTAVGLLLRTEQYRFEIRCNIVPHSADPSLFLHRLPPTDDESQKLTRSSHSEIELQHRLPFLQSTLHLQLALVSGCAVLPADMISQHETIY